MSRRAGSAGGRSRCPILFGLLMTTLASGGCAEHEFEPPDREAQVEAASSTFSVARYDSISWESNDQRALEGNVVWSSQCRNCHGPLGGGETPYATERGLAVPSLVEADWRYATRRDSVLYRIHSGHAEGMPTWSVAGISPREIDAVTWYLMEVLRPEVIGGGAG